MAKARRSGIHVQDADVPLILAMSARGDRKHDIAAWFGLNQGRIAEVENGDYGMPQLARENELPPSGSPGLKARELRESAEEVRELLTRGDLKAAAARLAAAIDQFDRNE